MDINEIRKQIEEKKAEARKFLNTDLEKTEEIMEEVRALQKKVELYVQIEDEEMQDLQEQKKKKEKE